MYFLGYRKALAARRTVVVNDESRPGIQRFYTEDPWSNRIELVDARGHAPPLDPPAGRSMLATASHFECGKFSLQPNATIDRTAYPTIRSGVWVRRAPMNDGEIWDRGADL